MAKVKRVLIICHASNDKDGDEADSVSGCGLQNAT